MIARHAIETDRDSATAQRLRAICDLLGVLILFAGLAAFLLLAR